MQYFRKVQSRFRGRRSTFARGTNFAAGAALSQVTVFEEVMIQQRVVMIAEVMIQQRVLTTVNLLQISGVRKVRYSFRSRRSTLASRCRFAAGAILSQGAVQISRQAQHFRKRCQFRGRRSTFARYGAEFDAGAALTQRGGWGGRQPPPHDVRGSEDSTRGALSSVSILHISNSRGVEGGGSPPHDVRRSDDSTKGGDDRRSDDSAKGAVISANIVKISGGVGGAAAPPMMLEEVMIQQRVR